MGAALFLYGNFLFLFVWLLDFLDFTNEQYNREKRGVGIK